MKTARPKAAPRRDEAEVWTNYHLMQVWDLLGLYFCCQDPYDDYIEPVPQKYSADRKAGLVKMTLTRRRIAPPWRSIRSRSPPRAAQGQLGSEAPAAHHLQRPARFPPRLFPGGRTSSPPSRSFSRREVAGLDRRAWERLRSSGVGNLPTNFR